MRRKFGFVILTVFLISLIWYLFLKGYNHRIQFETKHASGTVYATLNDWKYTELLGVDSLVKVSSEPFSTVNHRLFIGDSVLNYNWHFKKKNDSVSIVELYCSDEKNSLLQNVILPFKTNAFKKRNIALATNVMNGLHAHNEDFKVDSIFAEAVTVRPAYCAYISMESSIYEKSNTMIRNIGLIMNYIRENNIPLTGDPYLQVTNWDQKEEQIQFDFCFPIVQQDSLPPVESIKFKKTAGFRALKAIFNGNYRLSDRAWYALVDHAASENIDVIPMPLEIYKNDPHSGGNEMSWVAEVYMPIADE